MSETENTTEQLPASITGIDFDEERTEFNGWDMLGVAQLAGGEDKEHGEDVVTLHVTRQEAAILALGMSGSAGTAHVHGLDVLSPKFLAMANRAYRAAEI